MLWLWLWSLSFAPLPWEPSRTKVRPTPTRKPDMRRAFVCCSCFRSFLRKVPREIPGFKTPTRSSRPRSPSGRLQPAGPGPHHRLAMIVIADFRRLHPGGLGLHHPLDRFGDPFRIRHARAGGPQHERLVAVADVAGVLRLVVVE